MKTPLLLIACLATAVLLAGCAGTDDESTGDDAQSGRELNQDVTIGEGDGSTNMTNETDANSTASSGATGG